MRELIIKYPEVEIWDKDLNKWDSKDFEIFENLKNGILPIERRKKKEEIKNDKRLKGSKVIRISDNKEYQSISQCRRENGICSQKMHNLLKEEIFYKKVKI